MDLGCLGENPTVGRTSHPRHMAWRLGFYRMKSLGSTEMSEIWELSGPGMNRDGQGQSAAQSAL